MTDMDMDLARTLRRLSVETGSLICLGCEHEHACGIHGCAVMRTAADRLEQLTTQPPNEPLTLEELRGMADFDCCGCKNELKSRDTYPCNCCLRNEVLFADNYEDELAQREEGQDGR